MPLVQELQMCTIVTNKNKKLAVLRKTKGAKIFIETKK